MSKNWIAGAIKRPGELHRDLGVPQGEKIPEKKLAAAAKRDDKVGDRARLAETLKGMHHSNSSSDHHSRAGHASHAHPSERAYLHMIPSRSGKS